MDMTLSHALRRSLVIVAVAAVSAGCAEKGPLAPDRQPALSTGIVPLSAGQTDWAIATIRGATKRYQDLGAALDDGFVLLHDCETRPDEGPVGTVYVNFSRVLDGVIDPAMPDALIYEPDRKGHLTLVGAEFAIAYAMWTDPQPPQFMGTTFQREDEFGVFALHAWVWRQNPNGLFAETNPRVSCADK